MTIMRCKKSFAAYVGTRQRMVRTGDLLDSDDPIVKGREGLFEEVEAAVHARRRGGVEQATAGPGERRSVTPPAKKAAAKKTTSKRAAAKKPAGPKPEVSSDKPEQSGSPGPERDDHAPEESGDQQPEEQGGSEGDKA